MPGVIILPHLENSLYNHCEISPAKDPDVIYGWLWRLTTQRFCILLSHARRLFFEGKMIGYHWIQKLAITFTIIHLLYFIVMYYFHGDMMLDFEVQQMLFSSFLQLQLFGPWQSLDSTLAVIHAGEMLKKLWAHWMRPNIITWPVEHHSNILKIICGNSWNIQLSGSKLQTFTKYINIHLSLIAGDSQYLVLSLYLSLSRSGPGHVKVAGPVVGPLLSNCNIPDKLRGPSIRLRSLRIVPRRRLMPKASRSSFKKDDLKTHLESFSSCLTLPTLHKIMDTLNWLVVWTPLKNISQLGWLFPIYMGK